MFQFTGREPIPVPLVRLRYSFPAHPPPLCLARGPLPLPVRDWIGGRALSACVARSAHNLKAMVTENVELLIRRRVRYGKTTRLTPPTLWAVRTTSSSVDYIASMTPCTSLHIKLDYKHTNKWQEHERTEEVRNQAMIKGIQMEKKAVNHMKVGGGERGWSRRGLNPNSYMSRRCNRRLIRRLIGPPFSSNASTQYAAISTHDIC